MSIQTSLAELLLALLIALTVLLSSSIIYNLYLHSLSKFPGPPLFAISRLPYIWALVKGDLVQRTKELHDQYGHIIRIAPNELSFTDGQAWQDIYAHRQGRPNFPKNPLWMVPDNNGIHSILSANDADHARYRRLLSHAFSEKALRQQEYLLLQYVELLMCRLTEKAGAANPVVDMVQWLNFTTFDIIGDLALGESFHSLEESRYHGWVSILFTQFKAAALFISLRFFGLLKLVKMCIPTNLAQKQAQHQKFAKDRVRCRLDRGDADAQRNDFMTYVLRYNDEKGMSIPEIEATFRVLVSAGSETTATALCGMMMNLVRNKGVYDKLAHEIRGAFAHESEIRAERVGDLRYLNAVIEEGLRLCTPVPLGMPRVVPAGGAEVSGQWLPAGTYVSASGYSSNRSTLNFPSQPEEFDPSRWIFSSGASGGPSAFNPFSLGPRNCIGRNLAYLEMRLVLARLLWHFDFEADGHLPKWEDQKSWILWDKQPLNLRIKLRNR